MAHTVMELREVIAHGSWQDTQAVLPFHWHMKPFYLDFEVRLFNHKLNNLN